MIKILFLIDKLSPAGTQTNVLEIVKGLDRKRFEPHVIALLSGGDLVPEFERFGVTPVVLKVKRAYDLSGLKALRYLVHFMKEKQIDIVQNHFLHADLLGTTAARFAKVPIVITTRRDEGFWRGKRQLKINRRMNQYVTSILANSEAVKLSVKQQEEVSGKRIRVIYNGVDLNTYQSSESKRNQIRKELGIKEGELVVGMVATMKHEVKGHRHLLKAIPLISPDHPNTKFVFVGDGPLRVSYERYAAYKKVEENVLFLGMRRDISDLLNVMDVVCAPSLSEGFSNTILEAMAMAKPVIATNVGGNPELVLHEETGYLVRPRDSKSLAQKTLALLKDAQMRSAMGINARKRVEAHFSLKQMLDQYQNFYTELIQKKKEQLSQKKPFKIMYLIWSLDLGGAEQVVMNLIKGLDREWFEPVVCCLNEKGRYGAEIEALGIRVVSLHKKPKFDPFIVPKLVSFIKTEKIKLIHTHLFTSNLWGRIAGFIARVPVISTEHNVDTWKKYYHFAIDRVLFGASRQVIFVSQKVKDFYKRKIPNLNGKAKVLYNGIDVYKFKSKEIKKNVEVIGIVGRLVPQKSHTDFIEAIRMLKEKGKPVLGLIVGDGPLRKALEQEVEAKHLTDHIQFSGFMTQMEQAYQRMDLFVLCSEREGFPMTLLEAMASGVPVISTDVGGVSECIQNGKNGILVPYGNPQKLADSILELMNDQKKREHFQIEGRKVVEERFSLEKMVSDHETLYRETLTR